VRAWILTLLAASALWAADEQRLALALKAQSELDRVESSPKPQLADTLACVQSQAVLLPIALREELSLVHYHKGYCLLAGATITHATSEFHDAAGEFDKAIEAWPLRAGNNVKNRPPEPVSSALRILEGIAHLEAAPDASPDDPAIAGAHKEIDIAIASPSCSSTVMAPKSCEAIMQMGRLWLGWIALRHDDLEEANKNFAAFPGSGWPEWVAGKKAFHDKRYPDAAAQYRQAIAAWNKGGEEPAGWLTSRLNPPSNMPAALTELGGAQLLAGDSASAIATLDAAIKGDPTAARAFYLRGRAKELAGQSDAALSDYNLASRAAFANAKDLASGEAHLYRGIAYYVRKDYSRAEAEFSSALNFEIPAGLLPDATAWRHLAAVAGGSCTSSRTYLEQALPMVSPYFPKDDARARMAGCATSSVGAE
jgi:tetratricopeptide (TPR) repeat protein